MDAPQLNRTTELDTFAEHVQALVAAEPLSPDWVFAAIHAGGERAALEAVPGKIVSPETGGDRVRLHDLPHRLRRDIVLAELREGRGLVRRLA